jgi:uncharacterized protein (DUF2141 family)
MLTYRTHVACENLETRRLMSATVLNGTPGADVFYVDQVSAGSSLTIDGKGGADVVYLGKGAGTMQNIQGNVTIFNADGLMSVVMDNSKDAAYRSVNVSDVTVDGLAPAQIAYYGAKLTINDGSGDNDILVSKTAATDLKINGGAGDENFLINQHKVGKLTIVTGAGSDDIRVANSTGNLDDVSAALVIAGDNSDDVNVSDELAAAGHTYTLNKFTSGSVAAGAKLTRSGSATTMEFDNVGRVMLHTSGHDDTVNLGGTSAKNPVFEVYTNDGNDTVNADNFAAESLTGGNGNDTVVVDDLDSVSGFETVKASPKGGSIYGKVFADKNGNGIRDTGEIGIPNTQIFLDADNDKVWDSGEAGAYTDANGNWNFLGVPAGKAYVARLYPKAGTQQTTPSNGDGFHLTLSAGQVVAKKDFGLKEVPVGGSISGTIFNDLDGDGTKDAGETGLSGRTVWLDLDNDKVIDAGEATTVTDGSGNFKFNGLAAGTYKVRQALPAGWKQTTPSNGYGINVTLSTNQTVSGKLFGEQKI